MEEQLIEYCAPTLARLKTANLFNYHQYAGMQELSRNIYDWNDRMEDKGVTLRILNIQRNSALVYVCRERLLEEDLNCDGVASFLEQYGYESIQTDYALNRLKNRMAQAAGFPHEIGLFLGYPLGDVKGFIEHEGRHCKCSGCWKVYCDECQALRKFQQFDKCREVYTRLYQGGRSILQLTVAAQNRKQ